MSASNFGVNNAARTDTFRPQYDPASQLTTLQLGYGATRRIGYDNRGYLTTMIDSGSSGAISTIVDTYDAAGRKTNQVRDGVTSTYTMDKDDRLMLENRGGNLSTFAYDQDRNLTVLHNHGQNAVTMSHNALGQVVTSIAGSVVTTNTWDNAGRKTLANAGGTLTTFGWDQENRMTSRARGTGLMNFVYDESHHLRHKEIPGEDGVDNVSFNYLDDIVFTRYEEFFGTRTEQMTPWQGVNLGNASHDFVLDSLGNVVGSVRSSGVGNKISYFPYGEMEPSVSTPVSSYWKFVGGYGVYAYSEEVYLMWHRWYDANAGSFRSVDPLWPRESAYGYVDGMPQMAVDWEGLGARCEFANEFNFVDCAFFHPVRFALRDFQAVMVLKCTGANLTAIEKCWRHAGSTTPARDAQCFCGHATGKLGLQIICAEKSGTLVGWRYPMETDPGSLLSDCSIRINEDPSHLLYARSVVKNWSQAIMHEIAHCCGTEHRAGGIDPAIFDSCMGGLLGSQYQLGVE